MIIRTNAPSALDAVFRILSAANVSAAKRSNNEADVSGAREADIRTLLQSKLDEARFDFANDFVLVDGNSVWSFDRISKELTRIKRRNSTEGISKYFYNFMHLNFTTAQYNINGWSERYPTWAHVREILEDATCPTWKTDVKRIIDSIR